MKEVLWKSKRGHRHNSLSVTQIGYF